MCTHLVVLPINWLEQKSIVKDNLYQTHLPDFLWGQQATPKPPNSVPFKETQKEAQEDTDGGNGIFCFQGHHSVSRNPDTFHVWISILWHSAQMSYELPSNNTGRGRKDLVISNPFKICKPVACLVSNNKLCEATLGETDGWYLCNLAGWQMGKCYAGGRYLRMRFEMLETTKLLLTLKEVPFRGDFRPPHTHNLGGNKEWQMLAWSTGIKMFKDNFPR